MKKWIELSLAIVIAAGLVGCEADTAVSRAKSGVGDVESVTGSTILPRQEVPQPLFPDRDQEKIEQLLAWVDEMKPVSEKEEDLQWAKRSTAIQIHYKSGRTVTLEHAWTCEKNKVLDGISCKSVQDRVMTHDSESSEMKFYESKELFQLVGNVGSADNEWMPMVKRFDMPDLVKRGEPFAIKGNGWMTDSVQIEIQDQARTQTVWSSEVQPDHGQFAVDVNLPTEVPTGDYNVSLKGSHGGGNESSLRVE